MIRKGFLAVFLMFFVCLVGCLHITPTQKEFFKTNTNGVAIGEVRVFKNLALTEPADAEKQKYMSEFWRQALQDALERKGIKIVTSPTDETLIIETDICEKYSYISLKTGGWIRIRTTLKKDKEKAHLDGAFPISRALGRALLEQAIKNYATAFAVDIKKLL